MPDPAQWSEALTVARLFDTPFVYVYSRQMASGLLTDEAEDEGKIAIGGEFGFGEGSSVRGIAHAYEGVKNVLRHYRMLPGDVIRVDTARPTPPRVVQAPHLADYVPCPVHGIWEPLVMPGAEVPEGQLLGRLHDFADHTSAPLEVTAHRSRSCHRLALRGGVQARLDALRHRGRCRTGPMKITNVEVLILKSPGLYRSSDTAEEPPGPTYMGVMKVSTDAGIVGYSDMETAASVAKAAVEAPRWSEGDIQAFDGLASLIIGENPLEVERLWYRMYRGSIYYGRRGVAMQAISAIDIALWDIMGKAYGQPVHVLLGGKWRNSVRAYASTLFRPTPQAMREAATRYIDEGFTAVKFGWGVFGRNPTLDVQLVEAAREALGSNRDLLVDTGWFVERTAQAGDSGHPLHRGLQAVLRRGDPPSRRLRRVSSRVGGGRNPHRVR